MTEIINVFCGPGGGKSTMAAELYADMKAMGFNVELVREYVKDFAWENRKPNKYVQIYIVGEQIRREVILFGKVEYIITDSPVLLYPIYEDKYYGSRMTEGMVHNYIQEAHSDGLKSHNFFIERRKEYCPVGRFETHEEAIQMDGIIKNYLDTHVVPYQNVRSKVEILESVLRHDG